MGTSGSRAVNLLKNVTAMCLGLAFAFGLLEAGARVLANALGASPYMRYDERIGWKASPGMVKRHKNPALGFDVRYTINAHGHRGPYYERKKPAGQSRILILGDSNGFGWGLEEDQHLAAILDRSLENTDVINLSLSGYGPDQHYLRLCEEGFGFEPDLVILQMTENDFDEIQYAFFNQKPKPQFTLGQDRSLTLSNVPVRSSGPKADEFYGNSLPLPWKEWLGWNSYSYNLLNEKYYGVKRRYSSYPAVGNPRFTPESIALFQRLLGEIQLALKERRVAGLIVHGSREIAEQTIYPAWGLPVVDAWGSLAAFERTQGRTAMFGDGVHWNLDGHRIVADLVLEAIRAKRLLSATRDEGADVNGGVPDVPPAFKTAGAACSHYAALDSPRR